MRCVRQDQLSLASHSNYSLASLQEVAKLEEEKTKSNISKMSTFSMDSNHHVVDMEDCGVDLDVIRRRLRFRNTVSLVSRNTVSELSEDEGRILMDRTRHWPVSQIVGGRKTNCLNKGQILED